MYANISWVIKKNLLLNLYNKDAFITMSYARYLRSVYPDFRVCQYEWEGISI